MGGGQELEVLDVRMMNNDLVCDEVSCDEWNDLDVVVGKINMEANLWSVLAFIAHLIQTIMFITRKYLKLLVKLKKLMQTNI